MWPTQFAPERLSIKRQREVMLIVDKAVKRMIFPGNHATVAESLHYLATVYAGIQPTEQQKQEHMKDWITFCLFQLADPARNKDADSRVQALITLSELHGLNQPR